MGNDIAGGKVTPTLEVVEQRVEQRVDPTLSKCFASVVSANKAKAGKLAYVLDNKIWMCK